ncbi:SLBB domain-containing protein [Vibrio intestinalis]|uniref:SLBB domain-containing protein n=1 Tax=Vibrio intestinalis TaxID=2933291 RepID=UPI0021A4E06A|nr:SLBB domain-containing protein [Vibrio intestinalis]
MTLKKHYFSLTLSLLFSSVAFSATPTPAQLAQFKSLPKHQQQQLAKQMGVDLSILESSASSLDPVDKQSIAAPTRATAGLDSVNVVDSKSAQNLIKFGYDVFSGTPLDYTPVENLPVPLDYQLAPGDQIRIQLIGKSNSEHRLTIDREGKINIPQFGPEYVAGLTLGELKRYVAEMVQQKAIGMEAIVSMGEMRTIQVFVAGEVSQPGTYNLNGLTTLSQALIASGGVKETGSLRTIQLKRKGKVVKTFDAYDLIVRGNSVDDVRVLAGDTLFVPTRKELIKVEGEVLRPAFYEVRSNTSLQQLLNISGGTKPNAYLSKVSVKRANAEGVMQVTLNLQSPKGKDFRVKPGDEISIAAVSQELANAVALRGAFVRQGAYQFKSGLKVSDVVTRGDLAANADLSYALLVRENRDNRRISVYQLDLQSILVDKSSTRDFALQVKDQLFVFDSGIDTEYWYRVDKQHDVGSSEVGKARKKTVLDQDTGALVEKELSKELNLGKIDDFSVADNVKQSSREALLKPIIERLKAQASHDELAKVIEISGAVKYPGVYPLTENADFEKIVAAAGGFAEQAFLYSAELTRSQKTSDSFSVQHKEFSPQEVLDGSQSLTLLAQDHVIIKTQPNWQREYSIELQGEVVFPGTYTFQRGETIFDVIERAGGLTKFAYPQGAIFSRDSLKRQEQERLKLLNLQLKQEIGNLALRRQNSSATYTTTPTDALAIAEELANTEAVGRLVIDLQMALKQNPIADIMLERGDKLYVPAKQPVVSVMGEVQLTSNHTYNPAMSIEDYISAAGGTKKQADTDRVYVIRADGSVMLPNSSYWFSRQSEPLEPGDTIIVPLDTDYLDGLSTLTSATQILYQIGVAWSAVKN